jgi:hypothetical protein
LRLHPVPSERRGKHVQREAEIRPTLVNIFNALFPMNVDRILPAYSTNRKAGRNCLRH